MAFVGYSRSLSAVENAPSAIPFSSLVYESRSCEPFSELDLHRLVASAQARNRQEGVTGLLIYDQGRFLQWLEGPTEGLARVWRSIREDGRHGFISLLGECTKPVRVFSDSAMALGKRPGLGDRDGKRSSAVDLPSDLIETLFGDPQAAPSVLAALARPRAHLALQPAIAQVDPDRTVLRRLIDSAIVPGLLARHVKRAAPSVVDPHVGELAELLLATEPKAAFTLIDALRADGRSIAELCAGLFEPAARALGDLWRSSACSEFEVSLGLGNLQVALRRASLGTSFADMTRLPVSVPNAVLAAPSPHEPHLLGSLIASEMFGRAGWDVHCEFPDTDTALSQLVHDNWFDVLDLSLSGAITREHRLPAMAASIRAARASSCNPGLLVIVDGRVFNERPQAFADVGADAGSVSALDLVPSVQRQVQSSSREDRLACAVAVPI